MGHLPATGAPAYATPPDRLWCKSSWSVDGDGPIHHRFHSAKRLGATAGWRGHGATDGRHTWEPAYRPAGAYDARWTPRHWRSESLGEAPWHAQRRADWDSAVGHRTDRQRWLDPPRALKETHG